ncbi:MULTISPECIES: ABC transporter permease [Paeniglutamicibacter]|uniref:Osmoprotectant transport system permease protein n=1 Tax=Paeniglutamicibacter sulfureus TaxID=43666 RepID=A0ABU2BCS4_9MICC|nr:MULTISPECIES: ABC transporter permease [Paeniglutamicibacter]MCV9994367.1 ABC transporter permease [Paeniglutamicibacter sp. ZC-3]MDO2936133.1 ABC transporter permease [Paeniglutamicibacter sulfureus]MDR7356410.1 osmoprotectant transport system permease protein [Paeniglutamicibacter sulfureus]
MRWLLDNAGQAWALTLEHLYLSIVPTMVGVVVALALGLVFGNKPRARGAITAVASAIFTIPSLALFVVIPSIIGTQILDPLNVVIALSLYSASLLVRTVFDALDAVAPEVLNAAEALGYSRARRRVFVDLPLAVAPLAAGTRVAAVTNVSLVSVGAVIGVGGLGQLFVAGYQRNYPDQILAGIIVILALALVLDRLIAGAARLLTPWLHSGAAPSGSTGRRRPANGREKPVVPAAPDAAVREAGK